MRWNTKDCWGNPVTYYKGELVEQIKDIAEKICEVYPESIELTGRIVELIESEE